MRKRQEREVCVLLPSKQHLNCTVGVKARSQEVLRYVLEHLGVRELHLFGLAILRDNEYLFLDLEQKGPFILFLRVQYYVESGRLILSSKEQQLYYAELRQKVLCSQCRHQEALFFQLAASALQADIGDLEQRQEREEEEEEEGGEKKREKANSRHYFLPEDYFPSWLIKRRGRDYLLQHSPALHGEMRGVSHSQAILQFITEASTLQDGPITFYSMRQEKRDLKGSVLLGLALKGVHVYQEVEGKQCLLYDFSWTDIDRLTFQGRRFEIHAVGSLCLPKLVYYTPSAVHSKHILRHVSDSHRFHINTRQTASYIQQLEERQEVEMCVDEPEEVLVDNPAEISWLVELSYGVSVDGPLALSSSCWADITKEMKQVLKRRAHEGTSVD
ncbi:FERM domain-containing protein 6-like [Polymixia lowei]